MTYNVGTSTDYIDLLNQLEQVATSRHLESIAIDAAGTGYVAGDVLGITGTGATATHVAQIEVVTVGGSGEITAARVYRGGAYTVDPSTVSGNAATGGTGSGATFDLTMAETGWSVSRRTKVAVSASPSAAGTGYGVGNTLTLLGGVLGNGGSAATFTVATIGGSGEILTLTLASAGQYEVPPANPVVVSGGAGTGGTLTVTYANKTGDTVLVLKGDGGGSNTDPLVVFKTYQGLDESGINTTYNWAAMMVTAEGLTAEIQNVPNLSPGLAVTGAISTTATGDGAFVPLKAADAFNMDWWMSITGRRITMVAKVRGASTTYYAQVSIGLLNPVNVPSEQAYPAYVLASSDRPRVWYRDTAALWGGLADVVSRNNGPGFFWASEGQWIQFRCATISSNTSLSPSYSGPASNSPRAMLWPVGYGSPHSTLEDQTWDTAPAAGFDNDDFTLATPVQIYRTPDTGGDLAPLFALTVSQSENATNDYRVPGEIDGAFWLSDGGSGLSSEDRVVRGTNRYTVFQSGTRVEPWSFFCLRED